jgi:WD40 repeat protein
VRVTRLPAPVGGRQLLASAGDDGTVRIWDPEMGEQRAVLQGHRMSVSAVCVVAVGDRQLLASASNDRTVRTWDPETNACLLTIPTHYTALAVEQVADSLAVGLNSGILMLKVNVSSSLDPDDERGNSTEYYGT